MSHSASKKNMSHTGIWFRSWLVAYWVSAVKPSPEQILTYHQLDHLEYKTIFHFFIIPQHQDSAGSSNPFLLKTETGFFYQDNAMAPDDLRTQAISIQVVDLVLQEYSSVCTKKVYSTVNSIKTSSIPILLALLMQMWEQANMSFNATNIFKWHLKRCCQFLPSPYESFKVRNTWVTYPANNIRIYIQVGHTQIS